MPENTHYVYKHVDPETKELLYIGMGKGSRAYATQTAPTKTSSRYGHRSPEHSDHLNILMNKGYLPHEWIEFHSRGLSKPDALVLEKELIEKLEPRYNRMAGIHRLMFDKAQILKMKELRDQGAYYHEIATTMGCSAMTVHRILNHSYKRYNKEFEF